MPRVRVEDYEDFESDDDLNIEDDEPRNPRGQKIQTKPPRQDRSWEENRKELINRRLRRDHRD